MIQLATEPTASRASYRPVPSESKGEVVEARRGRTGHAWPFPSRYAVRPSQPLGPKAAGSESGS